MKQGSIDTNISLSNLAHQISFRASLSSQLPSQRRKEHACKLAAWKLAVSRGGSVHTPLQSPGPQAHAVIQVQPVARRHISPEIAATVTGKFEGPSDSWSVLFTHSDDCAPVISQPKGQKGFG